MYMYVNVQYMYRVPGKTIKYKKCLPLLTLNNKNYPHFTLIIMCQFLYPAPLTPLYTT